MERDKKEEKVILARLHTEQHPWPLRVGAGNEALLLILFSLMFFELFSPFFFLMAIYREDIDTRSHSPVRFSSSLKS